jgi:MFS family permease
MVSLATDQSVSEASASTELARNWPALVVAVWGASVGITGLIFYSFSTFVPLFQEREGWSRTQVAIGLSLGALGIMIAAPIVGRLVDRYGPRRVLLISIPLLAIGFTLPSFAGGSPWTLWIAYLGLALIGMGASPVAYGRLVVTRFRKARALPSVSCSRAPASPRFSCRHSSPPLRNPTASPAAIWGWRCLRSPPGF